MTAPDLVDLVGEQAELPTILFAGKEDEVEETVVAQAAEQDEPLARADADFVRMATGYAIGGVAPIGHSQPVKLLLDRDLQRFATVAVRRPELGLAELAVTAGYGDQSHLAKDARTFAGRTPRELLGTLGRSSLAVHLAIDGRSVQDGRARPGGRWAA